MLSWCAARPQLYSASRCRTKEGRRAGEAKGIPRSGEEKGSVAVTPAAAEEAEDDVVPSLSLARGDRKGK